MISAAECAILPSNVELPWPNTVEGRFWTSIQIREDCWIWQGGTVRGYGQFRAVWGERMLAHRYSYLLHFGELPDELQIHHVCGTKLCVNPHHLKAVTPKEHRQLHKDGR